MHYDALILGAMAGLCGSVARGLLELLAIGFIPSYKSCARLAAGLFLSPAYAMQSAGAYIIGLEVDFIVGVIVGVVAVQIMVFWGRDHLLAKGVIGGALTWAIFYVCLAADPLSKLDPSGTFLEAQVSLVIHLIFGATVVWSAWFLELRAGKGKPR
jgi:hypothetical protein